MIEEAKMRNINPSYVVFRGNGEAIPVEVT